MRKPGTVLRLAGPGFLSSLPEHHHQTAIGALNKIGDIAAGYNDEIAAAFGDRTLTAEGQRLRAAKATTTALGMLAAFDVEIKKSHEGADAIEKRLRAKAVAVVPKDVSPDVLRELRADIRQLSPGERLALYRSTDDPLVRAAIEGAPPTLGDARHDGSRRLEPFIEPAELAAIQLERAEAADPAAATKMHELRTLAEVYRLAVNSVRQEIAENATVAV